MKTQNVKIQNPFKVYEQLFLTPKAFFKAFAKETDAVTIAVFVALFLLVGKILEFAAWVPTLAIHTETDYFPTMMLSLMGSLASPLLTLLAILIFACLVHLGVSYFKKGTSFFATWKVLMYASLISIAYTVAISIVQTISEAVNPWPAQSILSADPAWGVYSILMGTLVFLVGVVMLIHLIYTEVIGLKEYHKLTTVQALVAIFVPVIIFALFIFLLLLLLWSFFGIASTSVVG